MGTDIHFFVEKRINGIWHSCDKWELEEKGTPDQYWGVDWKAQYYGDRNYDAFAILADVRNGYGFAGVDTGDGFIPISQPKGLPDDMSKHMIQYMNDRDWYHDHTWLTLEEILNYNWNRATKHRGVVNLAEYYRWTKKGRGCPDSYCGDVNGPGVMHITNSEMDNLIQRLDMSQIEGLDEYVEVGGWGKSDKVKIPKELKDTYTNVEWGETYTESAGNFYENIIPLLKNICGSLPPSELRCIFFFDS